MKIDSIQKGFYKAKVGDVILSNRTTERKAKDDGINYCLANGLDSYTIIFPDLVEVALEGAETEVVVVPPIEEKTLLEEMIARGLDIPTSGIIESLEITVNYKDNDIMKIQLGDLDITNDLIYNKHVQIINPEVLVNAYYLDPVVAGITEGVVSDTIALANTVAINTALETAKTEGNTTFVVPTMDAYFDTGGNGNSREEEVSGAIQIPDNMHFKMGAGTVLRRQPNDKHHSSLLSVIYKPPTSTNRGYGSLLGENVEISGGTLIGDINDHTYYVGATITSPATTTTASIRIQREYVPTVYEIPVTISNVTTNATEIASYINTNLNDMEATVDGATVWITPNQGLYVLMDDDNTDLSNIEMVYTPDYTFEFGFGISLYGAHNTYIHDITIRNFHGDAIFIDKTGLRNIDATLPSNFRTCENVLIQRAYMQNNRRQAISVVDCNGYEDNVALPTPGGVGSRVGIIIDNCDIVDTGRDIYHLPAYGIDLECYRQLGAEYARVENVIIKNSRFSGNRKGDLNLYNSQYVQVFNNEFTYKIGHVASNNVSIHDNTFTYDPIVYPENTDNSVAISLFSYIAQDGITELVYDFDIYSNTISGYTFGIIVSGDRFNVYSN